MTTGAIHPSEGWQNSVEMEELARFAVDQYNNKQNTLLEFKEVKDVKEQVVAGTMYYITILVSDCGQKKVYEAKIWVKPWQNFKELEDFKLVA